MTCKNFIKFPFFLLALSFSSAFAQPEKNIEEFMNDFHTKTKETLERIPQKTNRSGEVIEPKIFKAEDVQSNNYIDFKDSIRTQIMKHGPTLRSSMAEYLSNDNPMVLLDNSSIFVDNIFSIDSKKLATSSLDTQPWSDSYWPLYKGSIAYRYNDYNIPRNNNYNDYYRYVLTQQPAQSLVYQGRIDQLSPAEKYDLLMGDENFSLTKNILNDLRKYPKFEGWEGICHGWAPASYIYNRPMRSVTVSNPSGQAITFTPSDIKALTSLIWANFPSSSKIIGGRCAEKNPARDENGRIIDQNCFDTNPGSFHLALVNQLGIQRHGFVYDASYDYTVWNQPVLSYSYVYFNPETSVASNDAKKAIIRLQNYSKDKFRNYRSPYSTYVVGVKMQVSYIGETVPTAEKYNSPSDDNVISVTYYYDLELDNNGKIIGGEWYQLAHPDFMWTPASTADVSSQKVPYQQGNTALEMYYNYIWNDTPRSPLYDWNYYSISSASTYKAPLENIVRNLVAWSSVPDSNPAPEQCQQPCVPSVYKWHK